MFQFLNPIWLFGAAAVIIPVLIHLWNIQPGKVLKVGSISLIDAASRKSSRSFKLLDIPLFILRCLLLVLLALLLAMPVWQKKLQVTKAKGWLLVPKETLLDTYAPFKTTIDSLTKAGYEFHYFNPGFAKSNLQQVLLHPKDSVRTAKANTNEVPPNYWSLIKQLGNRVDDELPVYIITPNQARYFTGAKPQVALNLNWKTYTPADSVSTWIQDAWFTPSGNIRVVQGNSSSSGTAYTYHNVSANQSNSAFTVQTTQGQAQVGLANQPNGAVNIDTALQRLVIYTDNNGLDAGYLKAALQAVSQFTQRKTVIKSVANANLIPANTNWLFWLSEKPLNPAIIAKCKHILAYQKGKAVAVNTWMNNGGRFTTALQHQNPIHLLKRIDPVVNNTALWQDGYGKLLLDEQQSGQTNVYHYYSRFNPAWNDLVWSNVFPEWLLQLTQEPTKAVAGKYDKRTLSRTQYLPQLIAEKHQAANVQPIENKSLTRYFWLALILIFAAERLLAHRKLYNTNNA